MKRTGSSLRNNLVRAKDIAMGSSHGKTSPCLHRNCKCCEMVGDLDEYNVNGNKVKPANGDCSTYNIIVYCFICVCCDKAYVGRTVSQLNTRTSQHRSSFYKALEVKKNSGTLDSLQDVDDDTFSLGIHLISDHGCVDKSDFNKFYRVFILKNCSPASLEVQEHKFIHALKTLKPYGLNNENPFNIPLLNV